MKPRIVLIILSVFILNSCNKIEEKNVNLNFNHKILKGYCITSIAFDNFGNAYIGTFKQGIIRISSVDTIFYNKNNSIISDTSIFYDIKVDNDNNIWFGCEGLLKFDGKNFTLFNSKNSPIPVDFVNSIGINSRNDIWFTSASFKKGGIVKYNDLVWTVFTPENSDLPVNLAQSITIDNFDKVWIALGEKVNDPYLVKIVNQEWTVYSSIEIGFSPYLISNIQTNSKNQIYGGIDHSLGQSNGDNGPQAFVFDGESSSQLKFDNNSLIKSISVDTDDNLWCSCYFGILAVYNEKNWFTDYSSFKNIGINIIKASTKKDIWIGTGDGIYINER